MTPLDDEVRALISGEVARLAGTMFSLDRSRSNAAACTPAEWTTLGESGLLALGIAPDSGGLGGQVRDWGMVMRELGRNLSPVPYLDATILSSWLITALATVPLRRELLSEVAEGSMRTAFAHSEPAAGNDRSFVQARLSEGRLSGEKANVVDADNADAFLVTARGDDGGFVLVRVTRGTPGVEVRSYRLPDNRLAANLRFSGAEATLLGPCPLTVLDNVLDLACVCIAADSVGAIEALNRMTLEYAKTRQQFGQPIGRFQVIQHRLADMYIAQRTAAAMVDEAMASLDRSLPTAASLCSAAKAHADRAAFEVAQGAIQIHGGMGLTDECAAGHYLKRIMVNASLHGTATWHVTRATA